MNKLIHVAIKPKTHKKLLKVQREIQRNQVSRVTKAQTVDDILDFYLGVEN